MPKRKAKAQYTKQRDSKTKRLKVVAQHTRIPFVTGFKPPDQRNCRRAIGDAPLCPELRPTEAFEPIPQPISDLDWLAHTSENGQSYHQFISSSPWCSMRNLLKGGSLTFNRKGNNIIEKYENGTIYLLPLGSFDNEDGTKVGVQDLADYTRIFYGLPVSVLPTVPTELRDGHVVAKVPMHENVEDLFLTTRFDQDSGRHQIRVDSGLSDLNTLVPGDSLFVVIVTLHDLYCDSSDLFVAGIGSLKHKLGIFSFNRYDPALEFSEENWFSRDTCKGTMTADERMRIQLQRSCKLLVHEIGHLLGIHHCIYYGCVMNGSGNLQEDFRQPHHLCPVDLHKVVSLCGVDITARYERLAKFYDKHRMVKEHEWVMARVRAIKGYYGSNCPKTDNATNSSTTP